MAFIIELITASEIEQDYRELAQTIRAYLPDIARDDVAVIASLVINTCPYCHAYDRTCQCWNDE